MVSKSGSLSSTNTTRAKTAYQVYQNRRNNIHHFEQTQNGYIARGKRGEFLFQYRKEQNSQGEQGYIMMPFDNGTTYIENGQSLHPKIEQHNDDGTREYSRTLDLNI